jgi:hypothetical protein
MERDEQMPRGPVYMLAVVGLAGVIVALLTAATP